MAYTIGYILAIIFVLIILLVPIAVFVLIILIATGKIRITKTMIYEKLGIRPQYRQTTNEPTTNEQNYMSAAYMHKDMFTAHEKDFFYFLNKIVQEQNLRLFSKVRLFDLVTPVRNHPKYKTNLYKIQAKHLDYVITTADLKAKYVIELDDRSHDTAARQERDEFVDSVLKACGYKVLHIRTPQEDVIRNFLTS